VNTTGGIGLIVISD